MASMLLQYKDGCIDARKLPGNLRSFSWKSHRNEILAVGDRGRVTILESDAVYQVGSNTKQNLRGISTDDPSGTHLIVGNEGTILFLDSGYEVRAADRVTTENLRSVVRHPNRDVALITGNNGTLIEYSKGKFRSIDCGRANLRRAAWRPITAEALVTSNCFAGEFIPSPNLFNYDAEEGVSRAVNEGRADLIGVAWNPKGDSALVVGYDIVWHTGFIGTFDGSALTPIHFENRRVYPVAVSWKPTGHLAAIATATTEPGIAKGTVYLWDGQSLRTLYVDDKHFFNTVGWSRDGLILAALASSATRTFNC